MKFITNYKKQAFFFAILFFASIGIYAQNVDIKGKVTDDAGEPLPGVSIIVKGTTRGVTTDFDGNYNLSATKGETVVFSYVGFTNQEITVGSQTNINVQLKPDVSELNEVVVVGYGTVRKSDLTGATGVISTKNVELQPIQRVEGALQGRMAGVVVSSNSGAPGTAAKVNIRGFTGNPVYVIDGFIDGDINAINPNDIQSISILKDASATAVYGARGANGVILVTTKNGSKSKGINVSLRSSVGISELADNLSLLNPVSYMKVVNMKALEAGNSQIFSNHDIVKGLSTPGFGTNWQDEIFRTAISNNIDFALDKGWGGTSLRFSLSGRDDEGIVENSDYKRFTTRLKLNSDLTKTTKLEASFSYAKENIHNLYQDERDNGQNDAVKAAIAWAPNLSIYNSGTGYYTGNQGYGATVPKNPVYLTDAVNRNTKFDIINASIRLKQELLPSLSLSIFGAGEFRDVNTKTFSLFYPGESSTNDLYLSEGDRKKLQGNIQLDYNKTFGEVHDLSATLVYEVLRRENDAWNTKYTIPEGEGESLTNATGSEIIRTEAPEGQLSYLGRVNYSFKDKLLLTGSIRFDGSSRLPKDNQWDEFVSGAIAYKISNENFLKDSKTINDLKLRLSYGEIGNVNSISAFQVQDLVNSNMGGYVFSGTTVTDAIGFENGANRVNPFLKWEVSRQFNAGFDLSLWQGLLELNADYYIKLTDDSHFDQPVPSYLGGGSVKTNTGRIRNNGLELQLTNKWTQGDDFNMTSSVNFSYNTSKVLKIPKPYIYVGSKESGFDQQSHILIENDPVGLLWGYKYLGADPNTGEAIYEDLDNSGNIGIEDMQVIGNGHPDFTWGFNTNIDYKNFTLSLLIQGIHGQDSYNLPKLGLLGGGAGVIDATSTDILNSWSFNENGSLPSLNALYRGQSSLFVEDASFIRCRNITLAYNFADNFLNKLSIKRARIYGSVQNLFTITDYTGYDPEARSGSNLAPGIDRGSFPVPRTYTIGLDLNF
ncbi:MAG: SusC/RagA family TonB-linked outer membrane protein [Flavobacteriaceae bacterium]